MQDSESSPGLDRPAIIGIEDEWAHGQHCHCFCGVRHRERMGVCQGTIDGVGVRIHFNSMWASGAGVLVCSSCWAAFPEPS